MKVLMLNGSPRVNGNTSVALEEMRKVFQAEGVETEIVQVGPQAVRGCIACSRCVELGKCVFDDIVNELAPKFEAADGLVVARAPSTMPPPTPPWWLCWIGCSTAPPLTRP